MRAPSVYALFPTDSKRSWAWAYAAFPTALLALGIAAGVLFREGPEPLTFVYRHWVGLLTASTLMSLVQAFVCYVASFREGTLLALGGNTGSHIYDVRS